MAVARNRKSEGTAGLGGKGDVFALGKFQGDDSPSPEQTDSGGTKP